MGARGAGARRARHGLRPPRLQGARPARRGAARAGRRDHGRERARPSGSTSPTRCARPWAEEMETARQEDLPQRRLLLRLRLHHARHRHGPLHPASSRSRGSRGGRRTSSSSTPTTGSSAPRRSTSGRAASRCSRIDAALSARGAPRSRGSRRPAAPRSRSLTSPAPPGHSHGRAWTAQRPRPGASSISIRERGASSSPTTRSSPSSRATAPAPTSGTPPSPSSTPRWRRPTAASARSAGWRCWPGRRPSTQTGELAARGHPRRLPRLPGGHQGPAHHARRRRHPLAQRGAPPAAGPLRLRAPGALVRGRPLAR